MGPVKPDLHLGVLDRLFRPNSVPRRFRASGGTFCPQQSESHNAFCDRTLPSFAENEAVPDREGPIVAGQNLGIFIVSSQTDFRTTPTAPKSVHAVRRWT